MLPAKLCDSADRNRNQGPGNIPLIRLFYVRDAWTRGDDLCPDSVERTARMEVNTTLRLRKYVKNVQGNTSAICRKKSDP